MLRPVLVLLSTLLTLALVVGQNPETARADDMAAGVIVDTTNPNSMRLAREAGFTARSREARVRDEAPARPRQLSLVW